MIDIIPAQAACLELRQVVGQLEPPVLCSAIACQLRQRRAVEQVFSPFPHNVFDGGKAVVSPTAKPKSQRKIVDINQTHQVGIHRTQWRNSGDGLDDQSDGGLVKRRQRQPELCGPCQRLRQVP